MWKIALLVFVIFLCGIAAAGWILFKYYYGLMNIRNDEFFPEQQTITLSETADLFEYETEEAFMEPAETPSAEDMSPEQPAPVQETEEIIPETADNSPAPEAIPSLETEAMIPETEAMLPETALETVPSPEAEPAAPVTVPAEREEPEPVKEAAPLPENMEEGTENVFSILLIGVDSRKDDVAGRSDTMILFNINPDTKKIVMTSFLRDIYLDIPGYGGNRLNAAYAVGGPKLLSSTISANFGIEADKYIIMNFRMVQDVIDAFGGVYVDVTEEEIEYLNHNLNEHNSLLKNPSGTDHLSPEDAGTICLNGNQALAYARIRYIGTDFARTGRQREIISARIDKLRQMKVLEINDLLVEFLPRVSTNLTEKDVLSLLFMALKLRDYSVESFTIPTDGTWEYATVRGMSVIRTDFAANAKAWHEKITRK